MCESGEQTPDIGTDQGGRQIRSRQFVSRPNRTVHVLEAEDVLFHYNSAVMMFDRPSGASSADGDDNPEGNQESDPGESGEEVITGSRVLYAAYKFFERNPEKRLVLAGHTDTSGSAGANFVLASLRARNILHLLAGERDEWVEVCKLRHRVEDYQEILNALQYYGGPLNNRLNRATRDAVRRFTDEFNELKDRFGAADSPEIPGNGMIGDELCDETWGAFFDLYVYQIASFLGCSPDPEGMQPWRDRVRFIDDDHRIVACGESFPVENIGQDDYRSQQNRRVELLFFDREEVPTLNCPPSRGTVHTQAECPLYQQDRFQRVYIDPTEDFNTVTIDLETVDEFGHPVGNFSLELRHNVGTVYEVTTDADGFHRLEEVPEGRLRVFNSDGDPVPFFAAPEETAVIDTRISAGTITSLLVQEVDDDEVEERDRIRRTYDRGPEPGTDEGDQEESDDDLDDEEWGPWEGEDEGGDGSGGGEESTETSTETEPATERRPARRGRQRTAAAWTLDNWAIAAGWSGVQMDEGRCISTLRSFLEDFHSVVRSRRFFVLLVRNGTDLRILDNQGNLEESFRLTRSIRGSFGAYSLFRVSGRAVFLDLYRQACYLSYAGEEIEREDDRPTSLADLVSESDRDRLIQSGDSHAGQIQVFYHAPNGQQLTALALRGGIGYLENYGDNSGINGHVHRRNLAVARHVATAFDGRIRHYIEQIEGCNSEAEIRELGPPSRVYVFPRPAGATDSQAAEIFQENIEYSDYPAWRAITERLDQIADRHSEGSMFFRVKFQLNEEPWQGAMTTSSSAYVGTRVEYNLDLGSDGLLTRTERTNVAEGTLGGRVGRQRLPVSGGLGHEVNVETGETKTTVKAGIGGYEFEIDDQGGRKVSGPFGAQAQWNERTAEGGMGVSIPLGPLGSIYMGLHFMGLREETVLAYACRAPGLFDSMPLDTLLSPRTLWSDLTAYEIARLETVGFEAAFWNEKHTHPLDEFPEHCRTEGNLLPAQIKVAVVQLRIGLVDWTGTWRRIAARPSSTAEESGGETSSDVDVDPEE